MRAQKKKEFEDQGLAVLTTAVVPQATSHEIPPKEHRSLGLRASSHPADDRSWFSLLLVTFWSSGGNRTRLVLQFGRGRALRVGTLGLTPALAGRYLGLSRCFM